MTKNKYVPTTHVLAENYRDPDECPSCEGKVPNKKWFTDNGCIWCDAKHARKKK